MLFCFMVAQWLVLDSSIYVYLKGPAQKMDPGEKTHARKIGLRING